MKDHSGYRMQLDVDGKTIDLTCTMVSTTIAAKNITIIRLANSNLSHLSGQDEGTNLLKTEMPMNFYVDTSKLKKAKAAAAGKGDKSVAKSDDQEEDVGKTAGKDKKKHHVEKHGDKKDRRESIRPMNGATEVGKPMERRLSTQSSGSAADKQSAHPSNLSQSSTTMNRMMRTTFSKKIESTSMRLRSLRKSIVVLFGLTAILAIGQNVIFNQSYSGLLLNIDDIVESGRNYVQSVVLLRKLRLFELACPTMDTTTRQSARQTILDLADQISSTHYELYGESGYLPSDARTIFTSPTISIADSSNPVGVTLNKISFNEGINTLVSQSSLLATDYVRNECTSSTTDLSFVSSLVLDSLASPMLDLMHTYLHAYFDRIASLRPNIFLFSVLPISLIYIACVVLILAIFMQTNKEAKVLYRLFLDVPKVRAQAS